MFSFLKTKLFFKIQFPNTICFLKTQKADLKNYFPTRPYYHTTTHNDEMA